MSDLSIFADYDARLAQPSSASFSEQRAISPEAFALESTFAFVDGDNAPLTNDTISYQIMSDEQKPAWGTDWGNFFEIGLLPRKHFQASGKATLALVQNY